MEAAGLMVVTTSMEEPSCYDQSCTVLPRQEGNTESSPPKICFYESTS